MNYKLITFLTIFFLIQVTYALENTIVITAVNGTGDYVCDGVSDQIEINKALDSVKFDNNLTTVYLKGTMECVIDEPILISSNSKLIGDSTVVVRLKDNISWNTPNKPLIGQKNSDGSIAWKSGDYGSGSISNVEISGFELSGGTQSEVTGQYFVILINFYDPSYVKIHHMKLHDSKGDIMRFYGSNIGKSNHLEIYNNHMKSSGHEGLYFIYSDYVEVYNNEIYNTRTNSGIRMSSSSNFLIYENTIGNKLENTPSGYAGILVDTTSPVAIGYAKIYNNYIYGKNGGIVLEAGSGFSSKSILKDVHIHHNRLYKINNYSDKGHLNGAIRINGFHNTLIEHNTIEGSQKDGIVYDEYKGIKNRGRGYQTIVRNNIISNSKGYGINNLNSSIHTFISKNNNIFNNGIKHRDIYNYNNVSSSSDMHINPKYADSKFEAGWHHIVATYDSITETFKIYVDGNKKGSQQFKAFGNIAINDYSISLGTYLGLDYHQLKGNLDDMGIWERALREDEVLTLWNKGNGMDIPVDLAQNLKAYWKMENNWNDSFGSHHSTVKSTAEFSLLAKRGNYSGRFNGGKNYAIFPYTLTPSSAITISTWIYRNKKSLNSQNIQTIFNKGTQNRNNHIWLYIKGDELHFELGNGKGIRRAISTSIII